MHDVGMPFHPGLAKREPRYDVGQHGEAERVIGPVPALCVAVKPARSTEQCGTIDQPKGKAGIRRPRDDHSGFAEAQEGRKSVVWGKSVSVRVDLGGRRIIKTKKE